MGKPNITSREVVDTRIIDSLIRANEILLQIINRKGITNEDAEPLDRYIQEISIAKTYINPNYDIDSNGN